MLWRCRWRGERIHRLIKEWPWALAASGNIGTVFIAYYAPRWEQMIGWRNVFGLMAIPVVVTSAVFLALVRDDRAVGLRSVSEGDRTVRWWHAAAALIRHRSMYWLCCIYGVTFGGFVGLCSVLPLFFHDYYGMNLLSAGTMTALCGLAGSVIRPLGGYVADRIGGLASLRVVLPFIVLTVASIGYLPPLEWCVPFMIVAVGMMGFGNGAVFRSSLTGFTHRSDWRPASWGRREASAGFSCRLCWAP